MTLKSKILAAGLAVIIAGGGIFMANINTAQAQTDNNNSSPTIAQLQQMVETLKQQIQQIIALIAQLKPLETCGNSFCRFGETVTSCPRDCQAVDNCIQEGKWGQQNQKCCQGLTASYRPAVSSGNIDAQGLFICYKCGDGICSENELQEYCPKDCSEVVTDNGKAKCIATGGAWIDSDCAGCIPQTRAERNAGSMVCAKICVHGKICQCGNGKYWGSREEGCLTNAACAKEGEWIDAPWNLEQKNLAASGPTQCCSGLTTYKNNGNESVQNGRCVRNQYTAMTGRYLCVKCGDKICNSAAGENICSCAADCAAVNTCGNNICDTNETAASCPRDCQAVDNCIQEGKWGQRNQKCCQGLTANYRPAVSSGNIDAQGLFICYKCGDGICSENELQEYCPKDCRRCGNGMCEGKEDQLNCAADCGTAKCALPYWPCWTSSTTNPYGTILTPNQCCEGTTCVMGAISGTCLPKDDNKCGNAVCDSGETITGCATDCSGCQKWTVVKELGGAIMGTPDIKPAGNRLIIAGKGADNTLWVSEYYPANNHLVAWYSLSGQISGTPTISVPTSWNPGSKATIYAIGTDKNQWWKNETSTGAWGEWQTSGSAGQQLTPSKFAGVDNKLYRLTLPETLGATAGAEMKSSVNIERCDQIACSSDLSYYECQAAGGQIYAGKVNNCHCPATCNSLSGALCGD